MQKKIIMYAVLISLTFFITACGEYEFDKVSEASLLGESRVSHFYAYELQSNIFQQDVYDENKVSLAFRVFDEDGDLVDDLQASDLAVTMNGSTITNFTLSKQSESMARADIVFVLDETGSMEAELNAVKRNVRGFVEELRTVNVVASLCLVTFRDEVYRRCLKFNEDDPSTEKNENIDSFLNDLNQVDVKKGDGGDIPENQLAALISAAEETPWHQSAQRIAILITDARFHDLNNPGDAGDHARSYSDTISAIQDHQMSVFVVGPDRAGYSSSYDSLPGLADASNGLFFDIGDLVTTSADSGRLTEQEVHGLGDILDEIATNISAVYQLEYIVEDNGLDPTLPIGDRSHSVSLIDSSDEEIIIQSVVSSTPLGRPDYKKSWNISQDPSTEFKHVVVYLNGVVVEEGYQISEGYLLFDDYPEPGDLIRVEYQTGTMRDNMTITPIVTEIPNYDFFDIVVSYNGKIPIPSDYHVSVVGSQVLFEPAGRAFSEEDPYEIRQNGGLDVKFHFVEKEFVID